MSREEQTFKMVVLKHVIREEWNFSCSCNIDLPLRLPRLTYSLLVSCISIGTYELCFYVDLDKCDDVNFDAGYR